MMPRAMGKNRDTVEGLKADIARLKLKMQMLELRLEQERELHAEWVESMKAMHGAAIETLERIRVEEQHHRAFSEAMLERPRAGSDASNGAMRR